MNDHIRRAIYKSEYLGNISTLKRDKYVLHIHIPVGLTHAYIDFSFRTHVNNLIDKMIRKSISSTLTYLDLSNCNFNVSKDIHQKLQNFPNLTHLNTPYSNNIKILHQITHLKLNDWVSQKIELPPNIISLDLRNAQFNGSLNFMSDYKLLKTLKLPRNYINDLNFLFDLPKLENLTIYANPNINSISWDKLSLKSIKIINRNFCENNIKLFLKKNLPINIRKLKFYNANHYLEYEILVYVLGKMPLTQYKYLNFIFLHFPNYKWVNILPLNEEKLNFLYDLFIKEYRFIIFPEKD